MKKYILMAMAMLPMAFAACDDDDKTEPQPEVVPDMVFSIESDTVVFSRAGGVVDFAAKVNRDGEVSATCDAKWLKVSPAAGGFSLRAERNEAYDMREAVLVLSYDTVTRNVLVHQNATDLLSPTKETRIAYVDQAYEPDYEGGSLFVNFLANGEYTVKMPWWITLDKSERTKPNDGVFSVKEKYSFMTNYDEAREGRIEFVLGDTSFVCVLKQKKTEFDFSKVSRSAAEIAKAMTFGVNMAGLYDGETAGSVSADLLKALADSSCNVLRLPCAWYSNSKLAMADHVQQWATRVKSTVDAAVAAGHTVIVNMEDAGSWGAYEAKDTAKLFAQYENVWKLVAAEFAGYGDAVLFEAYGSLPMEEAAPTTLQMAVAKRLNELFVQAVRRSGALNYKRTLIMPTYAQDVNTADALVIPDDYTDDRIMVGFQYFKPEGYAKHNVYSFWGAPYSTASNYCSDNDEESVAKAFSAIAKKFDVPVVLTSFGANIHSTEEGNAMAAGEAYYVYAIAKAAKTAGIVPLVLDDAQFGVGGFGFLGRSKGDVFVRPDYFAGFKTGAEGFVLK